MPEWRVPEDTIDLDLPFAASQINNLAIKATYLKHCIRRRQLDSGNWLVQYRSDSTRLRSKFVYNLQKNHTRRYYYRGIHVTFGATAAVGVELASIYRSNQYEIPFIARTFYVV